MTDARTNSSELPSVVEHTPGQVYSANVPVLRDVSSPDILRLALEVSRAVGGLMVLADRDAARTEEEKTKEYVQHPLKITTPERMKDLLKYKEHLSCCNKKLMELLDDSVSLSSDTRTKIYALIQKLTFSISDTNNVYYEACTVHQLAFGSDAHYELPVLSDNCIHYPFRKIAQEKRQFPMPLMRSTFLDKRNEQFSASSSSSSSSSSPAVSIPVPPPPPPPPREISHTVKETVEPLHTPAVKCLDSKKCPPAPIKRQPTPLGPLPVKKTRTALYELLDSDSDSDSDTPTDKDDSDSDSDTPTDKDDSDSDSDEEDDDEDDDFIKNLKEECRNGKYTANSHVTITCTIR